MSEIRTQKQVDVAVPRSTPYRVAPNLFLNVENERSKQWLFVWKQNRKRRYAGLGSAGGAKGAKVTLLEARQKADAFRHAVGNDHDPVLEGRKRTVVFLPYALAYVDEVRSSWRGGKTETSWRRAFTHHAAALASLPVASITPDDVRPIVEGVLVHHGETGRHLRTRLEAVFSRAVREGLRKDNPATRESLALERRGVRRKVRSHPALPYEEAPLVYAAAGPMHKLMMLTATRAAEVAGARRSEFHIDAREPVWKIPSTRVKNGEPHEIPLTQQMLALLTPLLNAIDDPDGLLFPGARVDTMLVAFKELPGCANYTQHGLRSTFRDWCGNETNFPRDIVEETYGHGIDDPVEKAYRRRKALAKRRKVLAAWNGYVAGASAKALPKVA